jgi:hypothetical protein
LCRLLLDAAPEDWGQELGDLDLLAPDLVLGIEPGQRLGADLLAGVLEHEVQCPLLERHADLPRQSLSASNILNVLGKQVCPLHCLKTL